MFLSRRELLYLLGAEASHAHARTRIHTHTTHADRARASGIFECSIGPVLLTSFTARNEGMRDDCLSSLSMAPYIAQSEQTTHDHANMR